MYFLGRGSRHFVSDTLKIASPITTGTCPGCLASCMSWLSTVWLRQVMKCHQKGSMATGCWCEKNGTVSLPFLWAISCNSWDILLYIVIVIVTVAIVIILATISLIVCYYYDFIIQVSTIMQFLRYLNYGLYNNDMSVRSTGNWCKTSSINSQKLPQKNMTLK